MASVSGNQEIANANPFRYRGYYYDNESSLYYLQSRYYDSFTGRFLNADDIKNLGSNENVLSYNLFAYGENNPINNIDENGDAAINIICAAIGALVGWSFGDYVAKKL